MKVLSLLLALLIANFGVTSAQSVPPAVTSDSSNREAFHIMLDFMQGFKKALNGRFNDFCKLFIDSCNLNVEKNYVDLKRYQFEVLSSSFNSNRREIHSDVYFFSVKGRKHVEFVLESNDNGASYKIKSIKNPAFD